MPSINLLQHCKRIGCKLGRLIFRLLGLQNRLRVAKRLAYLFAILVQFSSSSKYFPKGITRRF